MSEKWSNKDWHAFVAENFTSFHQKRMKKQFLSKGKIILGGNKFSIGDFSLNYINIREIGIWRDLWIVIRCTDGKNYVLVLWWYTPLKGKVKIALKEVVSIISEKIKQFEGVKTSDAIEFIKELPNLYHEISFDDLSSRTGLQRTELMNIMESLILKGDLKAKISGNLLKLMETPISIDSPIGHEADKFTVQQSEKKEGLLIFVSYATKDADLYKISELAHALESHKEIGEVLYWQEDMHDSIIEYMNDNLGKCDVVLLFCLPHALDSVPVRKEWMAAEALKKPIIPIFIKPEHIPPLLSDRLGFEFDTFDFQKNIQEIYELILKKKEN